jgi:anti-sigma factor RsiW
MACEDWKTKLDAYADGELADDEMRSFDAHLRSCAMCSADALARVQMKRGVQTAAARRFTPSTEFRRKMERQVAGKSRSRLPWTWLVFATAVIVLAVGALSLHFWQMRSERGQLFREVADLHVATLASASPVDVVSTDRHTVKPWFQGRIPFAFNLPEVQNTEFSLLGGRVAYLEQTPGAQLIYNVRKHHISVFIFPEAQLQAKLGDRAMFPGTANFNMETWSKDGLRYFIVSDTSAADIERLTKLLKGE